MVVSYPDQAVWFENFEKYKYLCENQKSETSTFKRLTYKFENLTKAGKTNLNKNPSEHYVYLIMLITSYTNYFELVDATCLQENIWG